MELMTKQGYKETEVGLIPEDWGLVYFDEIFTFYSTSNYSKAEMREDDEVGCIHYGLIHAISNTQYNLNEGIKYYVNSEQAKYALVRDGDVIMVDASEDLEGVNKSVEVFGIGNKKYISGLHTYLLRDKKKSLADNFRGIILNSSAVKNQMLQLAVGMKVFGVSKTQLIKVKLPLPTLTEQKAIATTLSDVDALISSLEQTITKKKAIKQGAMQQLLTPPHKGGKRLPGYEGKWEAQNLKDIIWFQEGPGVRKYQFTKRGVKLLNGTNIQQGVLDLDRTDRYISEKEAFGWYSHFLVDNGDILIACSGITVARFDEKVTIAEKYHLPLCMNTSTMRFKMKSDSIFKGFFMHYLKSSDFKKQIGGQATGSAQLNFGPSHVEKVIMEIPTSDEQRAIAKILSDMDAEIAQLESKKEKYQAIKQGMMQELLTGKTRLK